MRKFFSVFILLASAVVTARADFFTATSELGELLLSEGKVRSILQAYLEREEERLEKLRKFSIKYDEIHKSGRENAENFLLNPINAFLLIKHLTYDLEAANNLTEIFSNKSLSQQIAEEGLVLPNLVDLKGASEAILRLQKTYLLDSSDILQIAGANKSSHVTAGDCFELGRQAHARQAHTRTLQWMQAALDRMERDGNGAADRTEVLQHMAHAAYKLGNATCASKLTQDIIQIDPHNAQAHENLALYQLDAVSQDSHNKTGPESHTQTEHAILYKKYADLCRTKFGKNPSDKKNLKCFYTTSRSSFLLLQPAKVEEFSLSPRIVVVHDVLSDKEIGVLKNLAKPKLKRAIFQDSKTGKVGYVSHRTSKRAYLFEKEHEVIGRVSKRIGEVTSLSMDTAEILNVMNYGIGGHFEPHIDFSPVSDLDLYSNGVGNRIATWMFYLSDVESGGATVFTRIGVTVEPRKGSAVFWYNLFRNGSGVMDTEHGGCPVLTGSKWVATKWFRERAQEFHRPCSLNPEQ